MRFIMYFKSGFVKNIDLPDGEFRILRENNGMALVYNSEILIKFQNNVPFTDDELKATYYNTAIATEELFNLFKSIDVISGTTTPIPPEMDFPDGRFIQKVVFLK